MQSLKNFLKKDLELTRSRWSKALGYLERTRERFDLAFLDPPFASDLAARALAKLPPRLKPGARVYVESADALPPSPQWRTLREDRAGQVRYALLEPA